MPSADDDSQVDDDLVATSESLEADARRVVAIESEKQALNPGDPQLLTLSSEAEGLAGEIQQKSHVERSLSVASVLARERRRKDSN